MTTFVHITIVTWCRNDSRKRIWEALVRMRSLIQGDKKLLPKAIMLHHNVVLKLVDLLYCHKAHHFIGKETRGAKPAPMNLLPIMQSLGFRAPQSNCYWIVGLL